MPTDLAHWSRADLEVQVMGLFGFLFGDSNKDRKDRDSWRPSVIAKNAISPINEYGTCFGCDGTGNRTIDCQRCGGTGEHSGECQGCAGSGRFERPVQSCFTCEGTGQKFGKPCRRCSGSGIFKPAISEACRRCSGSGRYSAVCKKCSGAKQFVVPCRKCGGSGWHKQKR